ncbi:MAG: polysaccharide biosynthesis C-terminal domain-containing protein [Bacilli bacterium]|nr:polysaccharide biosynthesis C-terminal domain-containing protein [Bacilli bacterium]
MVKTKNKENSPTSKKAPNLRRNFIFNIIYQVLVVLTPLITAPYIARVLGANNIGEFSFAYTIVSYFVIFAYLGFQNYAQRAIAEVQDDKEEQSRRFWQIVIIRLFMVIASLGILFILYVFNVFGEYSSLILMFSLLIAATAFDINFYFHGRENFFLVMIINLFIRLIYLFCIFMFIRSPSDLNLYALLYSLMVIGGYLSMWTLLPASLKKVKLHGLNFKKHFLSSLLLFLPVAAVSIYALLDKTLIGLLITGQQYYPQGNITIVVPIAQVENGYYFQAEKIVKALLSILLAVGTVMTTRNAIEFKNKRMGAIKTNVYRSFRFVFALGVPMMLGTIIVAEPFSTLYFGPNYSKYPQFAIDGVANLLMLYTPVIIFSGCSNVLGAQYLLPTKRDKEYSISVIVGFIFNLGFNALLIPTMGASGAIVGTLISEFVIVFVQYMYVARDFSLRIILMNIWKYILAGAIMCGLVYPFYYFVLRNNMKSNLLDLVILIPTGVGIYYLILLLLRDHEIFRYTKLILTGTGHFFKTTTSSFVMTVASITHFNHITNRQAANSYTLVEKEDGEKRE